MQDELKRMVEKAAMDIRAVADDIEGMARFLSVLPPTILGDGLDDEPMLDDHGYPVDMDRKERQDAEDREYADGITSAVESASAGDDSHNRPDCVGSDVGLEEIRALLVEKKRAGFSKEIKALLDEFGTVRVSDLRQDSYGSFLARAKLIGEVS